VKKRRIIKTITSKHVQIKPTRIKDYRPVNTKSYNAISVGQHTINLPATNKVVDISKTKVVIFCHFYYDDLIDEIFTHIKNMTCQINELWCSLPCTDPDKPDKKTLNKKNKILKEFPDANIRLVLNKGKDIGGKLTCLRDYLSLNNNENDWLIFCHDKKSPHIKGWGGKLWRQVLLSSIFNTLNIQRALSSKQEIVMWGGKVREGFVNSKAIAVHPGNYAFMEKILPLFGYNTLPRTTAFIGGTMFWVKDDFYRRCFNKIEIDKVLNLLEGGDVQEPSYTHAVERIFGILVTLNNKKIGKI
tara:strand:- start:98 stop:1000 length:903 start_codon:yes stop_codon:yes gene_type:complete